MNHDARHRLEELLSREITAAQSLAQILAAERAALTGDSSEVVKEMAAEKIGLLNSIEEMEAERRTLWGASGGNGAAFGHVDHGALARADGALGRMPESQRRQWPHHPYSAEPDSPTVRHRAGRRADDLWSSGKDFDQYATGAGAGLIYVGVESPS